MDILESMLERKSFKELDLNTHISLKNDYIFFQVSKVASSTVKDFLQRLEVKGTSKRVIDVNNRYLSPHIWPSQLKSLDFVSLLLDREIKKVSFVRNPYTRILSCYLHRIIKDVKSPSNKSLARYTGGLCGPEISFSEFVKIISQQKSFEQESHWRRQSDEIFHDIIPQWDFIGRFECLENDLRALGTLIGSNGSANDSSELDNVSPMSTGAGDKVKYYFDDATQETLYNAYKDDFINFNYSKEL